MVEAISLFFIILLMSAFFSVIAIIIIAVSISIKRNEEYETERRNMIYKTRKDRQEREAQKKSASQPPETIIRD
ncbi:MAG: hypothetical protein LBP25_01940 [Tannerellaceae bacterium]|nr:hypothetical protein [Tannerellaceae bacterium]